MKWYFPPLPAGQVETEVTQRDQFSNDEVELAETIVREAVQNSLDAARNDSESIRVSFRWINTSNGLSPDFLNQLLKGHLPHAKEAGLDINTINFSNPTALVIEDFGTKGLTGKTDEKDDDNFSDFWRRHGKSHKTGKNRGRWGLGKLVYSITSQLGIFFGATVRQNDPATYVMGQTVLNLRKVDGTEYPPHGFFSDLLNEADPFREIPVPLIDEALVSKFINQFSLERGAESGLSVIIPFPNPDFNVNRMIEVAIINYFYPVITGQLVLQFDEIEITRNNIRELAHQYAAKNITDIDKLFDFIEEVYNAEKHRLMSMKSSWADDTRLGENDFDVSDLEKIRKDFAEGKLVGLNLPVSIKEKNGAVIDTSFSLYVKRPEELEKGVDLYVRGGLTLPGESKFRERKAFGVMIAEDEAICAFLGDAENAAHTQWVASAEKVRKNYVNPQKMIKVIKNSLVELYDLLAGVTEDIDEQALKNFFWIDEQESTKPKRKPRKTPLEVPKIEPQRIRDFSISQTDGGFTVSTTSQTNSNRFPQTIRIDMAYNVSNGNPFKKYSPYDFTVGSSDGIRVALTKETGNILSRKENTLLVEVAGLPFKLSASGFDANRDLRIRLEQEG